VSVDASHGIKGSQEFIRNCKPASVDKFRKERATNLKYTLTENAQYRACDVLILTLGIKSAKTGMAGMKTASESPAGCFSQLNHQFRMKIDAIN